ncbi:MAG TPA: VOC family protein [Vicinamibacterales bacterium]|nr:VOC family protein [Vicinamibacterales bacterium]
MEICAYLNFNGQCAEAFDDYARCLGGKIVAKQTFGESPMKDQVPADWHDKIVHMRLAAGHALLMGSDAPPPRYSPPKGAQVSVTVDTAAEAERIFNALAKGGTIGMPFAKTFWSDGFGMCTDRFGVPWMVGCGPL